jgi:CubicO group peptidase (beta-lactamase class C family)
MSRYVFLLITFITAGGLMPAPALAHAQSDDLHRKVDAVFAEWTGTATPGCALGVSRDGKVDYVRGYGMSNLEYDVPIGPDSIFHIASISKQFTAFAIELLAREGKLSLDDDIRKYLSELPDYGKRITIAHLMHHTSGLRDQWNLLWMAGWRSGDDLITEDDVLHIVKRQRALNFEPGAEYLYSNTGYTLLAIIVKRVSGQSLRAFADARIFKPLGMRDTHFHDDHTEIVKHRTSAYLRRADGGWRVRIPVFDTYGATSLFTTVGDLLKWSDNFTDAKVGGRELIDAIQKPAVTNDGRSTGYGSGLTIAEHRGLRTVGHNGSDGGYRADFVRFPDQHLSIVALCNAGSIVPVYLTRKVAEVYLGDRMTPITPPGVTTPSPQELTALTGTYWSEATDDTLRVEMVDGRLRWAATPLLTLTPLGNGAFRLTDTLEWRFPARAASAGAPQELHELIGPTAPIIYHRVTAPRVSAAELDAVAGTYRSDELDATYTVTIEDGKAVVRWPRNLEGTALEPIAPDRYLSRVAGVVTFTRNAAHEIDGMTISNGRIRRLRFDRVSIPSTARR